MATPASKPRFDPVTGKPIFTASGAAPPSTYVDPITGQRKTADIPGGAGTTFDDVLEPLKGAGIDSAKAGLAELAPSEGLRPETLRILEQIRKESAISQKAGVSTVEAIADKRGIGGSSIEQFGLASSIGEVERARLAAESPILQQNLQHEQTLQKMRAQGLFGIGEMEQKNAALAANLTSDELASVRNLIDSNKDREVQLYLGERGIQISLENIKAAKEAAEAQQKREFLSGAVNMLVQPATPTLGEVGGAFGDAAGIIAIPF